jgi:hypothetical protein
LGQGRIGPAAGHPFTQLVWAWSGAVAHQLPQFARLGWGDPRLGQSAHPQQIGQIGGVAHVILRAGTGIL